MAETESKEEKEMVSRFFFFFPGLGGQGGPEVKWRRLIQLQTGWICSVAGGSKLLSPVVFSCLSTSV